MVELLDELILEDQAVELADNDDTAIILGAWFFVIS